MLQLNNTPKPEPAAVRFAGRRQATPMVIVDRNLRVLAQSFDVNFSEVSGHVFRVVERHCRRPRATPRTTVDVLDEQTALRVVDLAAQDGEYFAVTFERAQQRRDAVEAIANEHRLTNREREVFRMLLAGSSDNDVSQRLVIAKTTASDHAKNILRKTGSNKRTELFSKVIAYDGRHDTSKVP